MKIKHIIWDWNGTLLNDVDLCVEIIDKMLNERNLSGMTLDKYREIFDFPVKDYYATAGFDFEKESFEKVGTEFINMYDARAHESNLHEHVVPQIRDFHENGIYQSVLSARMKSSLDNELQHYGLHSFFEDIVGLSDHYGAGKAEVGVEYMKNAPFNPKETMLIGDTSHDFEVAQAMGINCMLVANGHFQKERLKQNDVNVFDHIGDAKDWLSEVTE